VNNYFIVQYIRAREGYNAQDLMHNVNIVRLMSEPKAVYGKFMEEAGPNNKNSPIARLGTVGTRSVKFKSITYISPQVAQVRVLITERPDKVAPMEYNRIILVAFEYIKMNLTTEERYLNPLGFRVVEYQVNEDALQ
jgi:type IV secretion system protein VirB8